MIAVGLKIIAGTPGPGGAGEVRERHGESAQVTVADSWCELIANHTQSISHPFHPLADRCQRNKGLFDVFRILMTCGRVCPALVNRY